MLYILWNTNSENAAFTTSLMVSASLNFNSVVLFVPNASFKSRYKCIFIIFGKQYFPVLIAYRASVSIHLQSEYSRELWIFSMHADISTHCAFLFTFFFRFYIVSLHQRLRSMPRFDIPLSLSLGLSLYSESTYVCSMYDTTEMRCAQLPLGRAWSKLIYAVQKSTAGRDTSVNPMAKELIIKRRASKSDTLSLWWLTATSNQALLLVHVRSIANWTTRRAAAPGLSDRRRRSIHIYIYIYIYLRIYVYVHVVMCVCVCTLAVRSGETLDFILK